MSKMATADQRILVDDVHAALEIVGDNTCWMWRVFFGTSLVGIFNVWLLASWVFLASEVPFTCKILEPLQGKFTLEQQRKLVFVPEKGPICEVPDTDYKALADKDFDDAMEEMEKFKDGPYKECNAFIFEENGTSIVEEFQLVCGRLYLLSTVQMVVSFGKFVGSFFFGWLADRAGRKVCFVWSCVLYMSCGFLPAIFPDYSLLCAVRFVLGMANSGVYYCGFTLLTEILAQKRRATLGVLFNMSYAVGMIVLPWIAYAVPPWRYLQLVLTVPTVTLIVCCLVVPESPIWLEMKGRHEDAWQVIRKANKNIVQNGAQEQLKSIVQPESGLDVSSLEGSVHSAGTQMGTFETPNKTEEELNKFSGALLVFSNMLLRSELRWRLLIAMVVWFTTALSYHVLYLNSSNFETDRYIYVSISGIVEAGCYLLPILILANWGRRISASMMYLAAGVALLVIPVLPEGFPDVVLSVAMTGRLFNGAVYAVIILFTSELFPTENRNTAIGIASTMSHAGGIIAPYVVVLLGGVHRTIPGTICGAGSVATGLLVLLLPETRGKDLRNTVEEMEEDAAKGHKVSIKNCYTC